MENKDIRVAIACSCLTHHDWMAFACWYSIRKFIPNCTAWVDVSLDKPLFRWVPVLGAYGRGPSHHSFPPTVMAVRDFCGDWSVSSSKSDSMTCLVDYSEGCGNFTVDEWINNRRAPFEKATRRFGKSEMTANEAAVLKVWEKCYDLYRSVGV